MSADIGSSFALDQTSRLRLRIFALKLLILVLFSAALASQHDYPPPETMPFFCFWQSAFAGMAALLQRHKLIAASLTAWDEMPAFLGLAVLLHLVGAVIR
jgi:hypothetical protein